ncbi:MAG TPA: hypothetical protein VM684_12730 [Gaiellales bacterium]|jgi:hypothetical protein|nr:hypothetical protein [Gaiellales bacterium]
MLRIAIPVAAVMLALLTGVGAKAPGRPFPVYPRPGGPPRAAAAMVNATSKRAPRHASASAEHSLRSEVDLIPSTG